jgi:hypothetical protein
MRGRIIGRMTRRHFPPLPHGDDLPNRQTHRRRGHDYALPGTYFITIFLEGRSALLGRVSEGEMRLSGAGRMVFTAFYGSSSNNQSRKESGRAITRIALTPSSDRGAHHPGHWAARFRHSSRLRPTVTCEEWRKANGRDSRPDFGIGTTTIESSGPKRNSTEWSYTSRTTHEDGEGCSAVPEA